MIGLALLSSLALAGGQPAGLTVVLSVPQFRTARQRETARPLVNGLTYVILRNDTRQPMQLLAQGNSWGDEAMSYEAVAPNGRRVRISGLRAGYDKNFRSAVRLMPGEMYVRRFQVRDDEMKRLSELGRQVSIRAIFNEPAGTRKLLNSNEVWVGEASSAPVSVNLPY